MIYPILQAFVSMIMASRKALLGPTLGIIEGVHSLGRSSQGRYCHRKPLGIFLGFHTHCQILVTDSSFPGNGID